MAAAFQRGAAAALISRDIERMGGFRDRPVVRVENTRRALACLAREYARRGQAVLDKIEALPKPVIAAINGFALGGGLELAMSADVIAATPKAVMGFPETGIG